MSTNASTVKAKKPFTVADEIGLKQFGDPTGGEAEPLQVSPNGRFVAVDTEYGRLDLNCVVDSLRFYRIQEIEHFLKDSSKTQAPSPVWVISRSASEGPVFKDWRWSGDSSGVAFLGPKSDGGHLLMLANFRKMTIEVLTSTTEDVQDFDVRDRQHFAYVVADHAEWKKTTQTELQASVVVGTGRNILQLQFPDDPLVVHFLSPSAKVLWAVVGSQRFEVKHDGALLAPEGGIALSPDGRSLATLLPVDEVPPSWETLYPPPPFLSYGMRIHGGHGTAKHYVRVDLHSGSEQSLTDAPFIGDVGIGYRDDTPAWSTDGQAILLPGTFLQSKENIPSRPCIAFVDLHSNTTSCVVMLNIGGYTEHISDVKEGFSTVYAARFAINDKHRISVTFMGRAGAIGETTHYELDADSTWHVASETNLRSEINVTVAQSFSEPPKLVAANKDRSRVIWDPNPHLKDIELGQVSVYKWKDEEGSEWEGGLYKPTNYKPGQRYPLVIQTHGFVESYFLPSGLFPTANAARALAAEGIMVLQIPYRKRDCDLETTKEGPCYVSLTESAAKQLVSDGMVDPERIGIIGFSRTCFYVMEMLTNSSVHFKAASVTDGLMFMYSQYVLFSDRRAAEANSVIGAAPFGEGLQRWLKNSPGFNLDKVHTPLMVVALGRVSLLGMWESYSVLHYLKKPVELVMLKSVQHILTNPSARMASQGGSVDWFRFWLKDEEDPDPAKADQYRRWRDLRKLQESGEENSTAHQFAK
jgi:dipeptidyl aminopeptidase/acylaminoacyl peptidase